MALLWPRQVCKTTLAQDIADGRTGILAIEIKRSMAVKLERGNHLALKDLQPEKAFVVYPSKDRYVKGDGVEAISLYAMVEELQRIS